MLPIYLSNFNKALSEFQHKFPRNNWSETFRLSLINDYSFYSSRVEDAKLQYGDTIRFLNNETIRGVNFNSLMGVSDHQMILKGLLDNLQEFNFTEEGIKNIHASLMANPLAWETEFKPRLVGDYRNVPTVGAREPHFENKEYAPHYNLEIIMSSFIDSFTSRLNDVDNEIEQKHLLTRIAYFHNKFLNVIHPFADGNGRVCRIVIGAILMKYNCPPIFPEIVTHEEQFEYISTIVKCEQNKSDELLVQYFAKGMTDYLLKRIEE